MTAKKILVHSKEFNRQAHADLMEVGQNPNSTMVVLFGGSGIDEDEYARRSKSRFQMFDNELLALKRRGQSLCFAYVTAPYDLPLVTLDQEAVAKRWRSHVLIELLPELSSRRSFSVGFSGGVRLAFSGLEQSSSCIGGAAIAPDGFPNPETWEKPRTWRDPLMVFTGTRDLVFQKPKAMQPFRTLAGRGQANLFSVPGAVHQLAAYREAVGRVFGIAAAESGEPRSVGHS